MINESLTFKASLEVVNGIFVENTCRIAHYEVTLIIFESVYRVLRC